MQTPSMDLKTYLHKWKFDLTIYMERKGIQNSQNTYKRKKIWKITLPNFKIYNAIQDRLILPWIDISTNGIEFRMVKLVILTVNWF